MARTRPVTTTPRSSVLLLLCVGVAGCAMLPAIGMNLAAQGAMGLVGIGLGSIDGMQEQSEKDRCLKFSARGMSITESLETLIPANEGDIKEFVPVYWRTEFARDGYPQVERSRTPLEAKLAGTDRALYLVPLAGATTLRIPYPLVLDVEAQSSIATAPPTALLVKSCFGRFDIVTFPPRPGSRPDAIAVAAAELKSRMTAAHVVADK